MNTYRDFVLSRINSKLTDKEKLGAAFMGLVCEAGEAGDNIKKHLYQNKELDRDAVLAELGDVRFYLEWCCLVLGTDINAVEKGNVEKLSKRYPTGFSG